jgi:hypothetical protein
MNFRNGCIPDQHFDQVVSSTTPQYLSTRTAACYHSSHVSSSTIYYHILIVYMSGFSVVRGPYFAQTVTLAEVLRVGDSNVVSRSWRCRKMVSLYASD